MTKTEEMNFEILNLNKELIKENQRVVLQNEKWAKEEHKAKMEIFNLQRIKMIQEMSENIEPQALSAVKEFHELFGHPVLAMPLTPNEDRIELRIGLIQEELNELI